MTIENQELSVKCEEMVELIRQEQPRGQELLYTTFVRGLRYLAARHCPAYAEDCVHDTIVAVIRQIRAGQLQTPAALPGYLNIVLKRTAWSKKVQAERMNANAEVFDTAVSMKADERADPQQRLESRERVRILRELLSVLQPGEREILTRFYLHGETPERICRQMQMTETQFRLNKSRSKKKLEVLTQKRLQQRAAAPVPFAFAS